MMKEGKNKTIFITGCRGGIGRYSAITLAKRGHRVIATTHTSASAKEINALAAAQKLNIESFKLDVTVPKDRDRIRDYDIDVLINNAGIGESGPLAQINVDRVRNNFEVNVFGPLELTQLALKKMMKKDSGTVIFVSSLIGRIAFPFLGSYSMTKFSVSCEADVLRQELYRITKNVNVSVVELGAYHTGFNQRMLARKYEWLRKRSYFNEKIREIKMREEKFFSTMESESVRTAVNQIVKAAESSRPRFRYVAPFWQGTLVQLGRALGK